MVPRKFRDNISTGSGVIMLLLLLWRTRQATAYMRRQRCPEEMRNSTRLWIWRDPSLPRDSWQPFIDWGTTQGWLLSCTQTDRQTETNKQTLLINDTTLTACVAKSSTYYHSIHPSQQQTCTLVISRNSIRRRNLRTWMPKNTDQIKLDYIDSPAHCCIMQPPVAPSGDSARVIV